MHSSAKLPEDRGLKAGLFHAPRIKVPCMLSMPVIIRIAEKSYFIALYKDSVIQRNI